MWDRVSKTTTQTTAKLPSHLLRSTPVISTLRRIRQEVNMGELQVSPLRHRQNSNKKVFCHNPLATHIKHIIGFFFLKSWQVFENIQYVLHWSCAWFKTKQCKSLPPWTSFICFFISRLSLWRRFWLQTQPPLPQPLRCWGSRCVVLSSLPKEHVKDEKKKMPFLPPAP